MIPPRNGIMQICITPAFDMRETGLSAKCTLHPGRPGVDKVFDEMYCQMCLDHIAVARKAVDRHVEPKACFVVYEGKDKWSAIEGTGCAHWMSHQLGIKKGGESQCCLAGFTFRVPTALSGHKEIAVVKDGKVTSGDISKVRKGSLFAKLDESHCGIVTSVTAAAAPSGKAKPGAGPPLPGITIENDSSAQGGVKKNDFADYFKSSGKFLT